MQQMPVSITAKERNKQNRHYYYSEDDSESVRYFGLFVFALPGCARELDDGTLAMVVHKKDLIIT